MESVTVELLLKIIVGLASLFAALKIYKIIDMLLHRKTVERKGAAESNLLETDSLIKRYSIMEDRVRELEAKVDELYQMIHKLEKEKIELMQEKLELSVELKEARYNECRRPDDDCLKRLPQREICLAKKLLGGTYDKEIDDTNA